MDPIKQSLPKADTASTLGLVSSAKRGDREAWSRLVERYYAAWLDRYHGSLGTEVRRVYDTEDLVQSAVAEAFQGLSKLRDESVFFVWVTAILRHKVALRYRENRRLRRLEPGASGDDEAPAPERAAPQDPVEFADTYLHALDAILAAFPERPNWMTALVLRYLDGLEVGEAARRLGIPERTAHHWVTSGTRLLKKRLAERDWKKPA